MRGGEHRERAWSESCRPGPGSESSSLLAELIKLIFLTLSSVSGIPADTGGQ